jgi:hypothetical protein
LPVNPLRSFADYELFIETLETFSRHFGVDSRVRRDSAGWNAFGTARELRNRLLHPKNATAFQFRNSDLNQLLATRNWWYEEVHGCLSLTLDSGGKLEELIHREILGLRKLN